MVKNGRLKIDVCSKGQYFPIGTNVIIEEVICSDKTISLHITSIDHKHNVMVPNTNIDRFI